MTYVACCMQQDLTASDIPAFWAAVLDSINIECLVHGNAL